MAKLPIEDCLLFMQSESAILFISQWWQEDQDICYACLLQGWEGKKRQRDSESLLVNKWQVFYKNSCSNGTNIKDKCWSTYLDNRTSSGNFQVALGVRVRSGIVGAVKLSVQPTAQNVNSLWINNVTFFRISKRGVGGHSVTWRVRTVGCMECSIWSISKLLKILFSYHCTVSK